MAEPGSSPAKPTPPATTPAPSGRLPFGPRSGARGWMGHGGGQQSQVSEKLVSINRVAKVHKGGKRLAFNALAVVGDGQGRVGLALGRANEASDAIRKAFNQARERMVAIPLKGSTITHEATGKFDASVVLLKPASPGTGIIAGGPVRAVCEACGIRDILTKSLGSSNAVNLAKATLEGLMSLQTAEAIQQRRKLLVEELPQ